MKFKILVVALVVLMSGCKKENGEPEPDPGPTCGVEKPTEELAWLKAEIDDIQGWKGKPFADYFVYRAIYKGNTVIWIHVCCPACDTIPPKVRDCEGTFIGQWGTDVPDEELTEKTRIWRTKNGVCP